MRVVWSILVIECGDYGTSPRFGWIYNNELIIDIIREVIDWEDREEKYLENKLWNLITKLEPLILKTPLVKMF